MAYSPFKMKGNPMKRNFGIGAAPMKMKKSAAKIMEESPAKMMKKSPAKKPLVGKQKNLPEELKKKILASPTKMVKKGATSNARSKTPGPIVADTRVSTSKTSKSIGPAESPKAIKAKADKVLLERKKAEKNNPGGFMPESKESVAAKKEYDSASSFLKMKKESAMKMKKEPGRGGAKLMSKTKLAKIQKRQEEEKMIKGVEKTRAKELARKRKPKPGGALKMKKKK